MSSDRNYVPLINREKSSRFTESVSADIRIPFAPYHLIPEELKIPGKDYESLSNIAKNDYTVYKFQNQVDYNSYLDEAYLHKPRQLLKGGFSYSLPEIRKEYKFLTVSPNAVKDLKINLVYELNPENETYFKEIISGQKLLPKPFPFSQAYAGYQFGTFAGQLGDGRVVNLFGIKGKNDKTYEVQLKGSGKTPFARFADGKAILRSSVREFIIAEYLNAIGIPSTRCLAITALPKTYAQRSGASPCCVVTRFAESCIRIGTFDLYRARGDREGLKEVTDYCIEKLFGGEKNLSRFDESLFEEGQTKYDMFYLEVVKRNARSTALGQVYGFLNGVLNTDNTSILGLCIDFGPFAIMDKFDPNYTPNSEDHQNRYGYNNVPSSIFWNLTRLGEDLGELIGSGPKLLGDGRLLERETITEELEGKIIKRANKVIDLASKAYEDEFEKVYVETFNKRLGLATIKEDDNDKIISPMLEMLWETQINYNRFFVLLNSLKFFDDKPTDNKDFNKSPTELVNYKGFAASFIPKDFKHSKMLTNDEISEKIEVFLKKYHERLIEENTFNDDSRLSISKNYNPIFVPSNWVIEEVVDELRDNRFEDISQLEKLTKMICNPFDSSKWGEEHQDLEEKWKDLHDSYDDTKYMLQCSCAS